MTLQGQAPVTAPDRDPDRNHGGHSGSPLPDRDGGRRVVDQLLFGRGVDLEMVLGDKISERRSGEAEGGGGLFLLPP